MKVAELRLKLSGLVGVSDADLDILLNVLEPLDNLTIADLCEKIASGKVKKKKSTAAKEPKAPAQPANELEIARYVEEFRATKDDNASFEAVIGRLERDRTIKLPQAQLIADKFTGQTKKYPSKPKAIKAILDRQIADKRSASRGPQISGLF